MKVLMINGSPHANGNTFIALQEMEKVFAKEGVETEIVHVGNQDIRGCIACYSCYEKGRCVFDDIVNETAPKFEECDGLVIASPVYYASANATLIAFLDRLFYSTHFDKRMKVGASVVAARRGGLSATFDELNKYFTIAAGIEPILEQYPRQNAGGGVPGCGGAADHAHTGSKYGISHEEHCTWKRGVRFAGTGSKDTNELYPLKWLPFPEIVRYKN